MPGKKFLVTLRKPEDAQIVRASGVGVLAEYPHSMLIRADDDQERRIKDAKLETTELPSVQIHLSGTSFALTSALEAQKQTPIKPSEGHRRAYYLVQLIGPAKNEWLEHIRALGGAIHGSTPTFTYIVGIEPDRAKELAEFPFIEAVTPYRPTMKVAPELTKSRRRSLDVESLATLDTAPPVKGDVHQVQVQVFPGESSADVSAAVKAAGGSVLSQTTETVTAMVPSSAIGTLAEQQGVQSILPHRFPKLFNDRARSIMAVPATGVVGQLTLRGKDQIVAIADSGLGNGDKAAPHPDFRGRVADLVSFPFPAGLLPFTDEKPGFDDGPADDGTDDDAGHGTHVCGSVLGDGAAARQKGSNSPPVGIAPEASVYFQAVAQGVRWKSANELSQQGTGVPSDWPPSEFGLYGLPDDLNNLFRPAYAAGARIHSDSWGSSDLSTQKQYNANAQDVDEFSFNHRDMLILFAAGNAGVDADGDGVIDLGSISPPGTAKNCLTIGASESNRPLTDQLRPPNPWDGRWDALEPWRNMTRKGAITENSDGMTCFSSRGPTAENRIKPDVVAPGASILSTRSSALRHAPPLWGDLPPGDPLAGLYCWSGGTSMSTPLVAGLAALVRQHLVSDRNHFQPGSKPSGALIKAFLVNGAVALAGQFPGEIPPGANPVCGFGRVNLIETVAPGGLMTQFDDDPAHAVGSGEMRTYSVKRVDPARPLSVTLVWMDAPSLPGNGSLENKLYLQVVQPDGTVLDGDVSAFPIATNNVQRIRVPQPADGSYQIRVRGVDVGRGSPAAPPGPPRQDFALVVSNVNALDLS
jgi:serine protease AprX